MLLHQQGDTTSALRRRPPAADLAEPTHTTSTPPSISARTQLFVFLTNLLLIFCFIFFIILAVFGIASGQDTVKEEWAKTTSTCTTSADEMLAQVVTANTTLQLAKIGGVNTTVQQITLNAAEAQCVHSLHTTTPPGPCLCRSSLGAPTQFSTLARRKGGPRGHTRRPCPPRRPKASQTCAALS